jgi:hypothetical protein
MTETCPVPTPDERRYLEIQDKAEAQLWAAVMQALDQTASETEAAVAASGVSLPPPARDYFAAFVQQRLFVTLCGGDPDTFLGGDPEIAEHIIEKARNISEHYWTATSTD